ncbi:MAG TPA: hypothetical protein VIT88_02690 [Pyrinomonadaceae bacterium]
MKQKTEQRPLTGRYQMPADTGGPYTGLVNVNRPRMADVLADAEPISKKPSKRKPNPSVPPEEPPAEISPSHSSYVRLRVRLHKGELTVEEMWSVEGQLTEPPFLFGPFVWEVRLDDRRIAMGDIADMGEQRAGFDPKNPELGHWIAQVPEAEIPIRIAGNLSAKELARAELFLSELKLRINRERPNDQPLHVQWSNALRLIAQLRGLAPKRVPLKRPSKKPSKKSKQK